MGTTYSISIIDYVYNEKNIKEDIDSLLLVINNNFSRYIKGSKINYINNSSLKKISASNFFINVLDKALYYCDISNGKYDVTAAPLIDLWGFSQYDFKSFPTEESIDIERNNVGCKKINVDGNFILRENRHITIDLNSIAGKSKTIKKLDPLIKVAQGLGIYVGELN